MTSAWPLFAVWALLVACASASSRMHTGVKRANLCNGYSSYCNRPYSNITYVGAHDSYAIGDTSSMAANQALSVGAQLDAGVRALQIQGHANNGSKSGISLCHTSCTLYDGGTLEAYLTNVTTWVEANPNDVLTLFIANNDNLPASTWAKGFQSAGLSKYTYQPGTNALAKNNWPTLQTLLSQKQRVVVFMDYKADVSSVSYILPEFQNVWEDPYDQTSMPFNCTPDRIQGSANQMMYLHNHVLDEKQSFLGQSVLTPNTAQLGQTNSQAEVVSAAAQCASQHSNYPTFVLFDFVNTGNVFQAVAQMNSVRYKPSNTTTASPAQSHSGASAHATIPTASLALAVLLLGWASS